MTVSARSLQKEAEQEQKPNLQPSDHEVDGVGAAASPISSTTGCCECCCYHLPIIFLILFLLLIAIFLTIAFSSTNVSIEDEDQLNTIRRIWNESPIIFIRADLVGCHEYLTAYDFPGTITGCDCRAVLRNQFTPSIFPFECTSEHLHYNCRTVTSTPTTPFTSWQIGNNIFQLCIDRIPNFTFFDSDCSNADYQKCFAGGQSNSKTDFCIPKSYPCPIRSIVYGNTRPIIEYESILTLNDGSEFYISRVSSSDRQVLALGRVSPGSRVCRDFDNLRFIDTNISPYILMHGRNNTCFLNTDDNFIKITTISEEMLLKSNQNHYDIISSLPGYSFVPVQTYTLNARGYTPWSNSQACRDFLLIIQDLSIGYNENYDLLLAGMIICWVSFALYGILAAILRARCGWRIKNYMVLVTVIFLAVQLGILIALLVLIAINSNDLSGVRGADCSDEYTNELVSTFQGTVVQLIMLSLAILAMVAVIIISIIWRRRIFVLRYCCGYSSEETPEEAAARRERERIAEERRRALQQRIEEQDEMLRQMKLKEDLGEMEVDMDKAIEGGYPNLFELFDQESNSSGDEESSRLDRNGGQENLDERSSMQRMTYQEGINDRSNLSTPMMRDQLLRNSELDGEADQLIQQSSQRPQHNFFRKRKTQFSQSSEIGPKNLDEWYWRNKDLIQEKALREPLDEIKSQQQWQQQQLQQQSQPFRLRLMSDQDQTGSLGLNLDENGRRNSRRIGDIAINNNINNGQEVSTVSPRERMASSLEDGRGNIKKNPLTDLISGAEEYSNDQMQDSRLNSMAEQQMQQQNQSSQQVQQPSLRKKKSSLFQKRKSKK